MVRLDLLGQLPNIAAPDTELILASAVLGVLRTHLLVAEHLELLERLLEAHGRDRSDGGRPLGVRASSRACWTLGSDRRR